MGEPRPVPRPRGGFKQLCALGRGSLYVAWAWGFVGHCPTGWLSHPTACSAAMQGPALASRDTRSRPNLGPRVGALPNLPSVSPGGGCDSGLEGCWAHTCPPFPDKAEKVFSKAVTPISDTQTRSISAFPEAMTQIAGSRGPSLTPSGFSITSALTCSSSLGSWGPALCWLVRDGVFCPVAQPLIFLVMRSSQF